MRKQLFIFFITIITCVSNSGFSQTRTDTIVLRDIIWDNSSPACMMELAIPSGNSLMQGFMYKANGDQEHPTLILLHGYPGNERNLDLALVIRAHGWNALYFNYRGSWGSQGQFSFKNCVEDAINVVGFCKKYQDSLQIDTSNIVLFGHSMGAWVCLKALEELPGIKKGFALSTWNIYAACKNIKDTLQIENMKDESFVLNTPAKNIYKPVIKNPTWYNIANDGKALADKKIMMLDEHPYNKELAAAIKSSNKSYFDYEVWQTDHSFTNKRVSLMKSLLAFMDK